MVRESRVRISVRFLFSLSQTFKHLNNTTIVALTFSGHDRIIGRGANNFCDTLVEIYVLSIDVGESVLNRALVHLQFNDFLLHVVSI